MNIYRSFLSEYLSEAKSVFVSVIEGLGTISYSPWVNITPFFSKKLVTISNADMDQVTAVVKMVGADQTESSGIRDTVQASTTRNVSSECEQKSSTVIETVESTYETELVKNKEVASAIETQTISKMETEVQPAEFSYRPINGFIKPGITNFFQRDSLTEHQKSWSLHNLTHGIEIDIPVKAVPSEIMQFVVIAHAYLYGKFKIPEEYEVCTAIVTLRTQPNFQFQEKVSLTLPHSAVFDGDEEDEDLVVLCAPDPSPNIEEYDFTSDIIHGAAVSFDGYKVHVSLDHFSAVAGAKRKQKYRTARCGSPCRRQVRSSKQTSTKSIRRVKLRSLRSKHSGDSNSLSQSSSYNTSFARDAPYNPRQGSSAESEALLHRQGAIDDYIPGTSTHVVHQTSSEADDESYNEIRVAFCYPKQRHTSWTNRFLVAPNHPTGIKALYDSIMLFGKSCQGKKIQCVQHTAIPCSRTLCFGPNWKNSEWIVKATSTPQISLDIVQYIMQSKHTMLQFVDFEAESTNQQSSTPLEHVIWVTGVDKELFFTIQSPKKPENTRKREIYIKSWLYTEDSQILMRLKLPHESEDKNFALNLTVEDYHFKADICKLMAEIAFQVAGKDTFMEQIPISDHQKERLYLETDATERIYMALFAWIHEKRPSFFELEWLLRSVGFENIVLSGSDAPMQDSSKPCERQLCTHLARKLQHKHWKFVGRYLGLDRADIDGLEHDFHYRGGLTEVIFKMLEIWCQQFGKEAKTISLLKAVSRVNMLDLCCLQDAVSYLEKELSSTERS